MNTLIYMFILSVLNALMIYTVYDFYETYFQKPYMSVQYRLLYIVGYIILIVVSAFNFLFIYDFIIYWLLLFSITALYKSTFKNRVFISLLCLVLIEGIEILAKITVAGLYDTTVEQIMADNFTTLIAYSIARILPFVGMKIYTHMEKENIIKSKEYDFLKTIKWFVFILIPLFSLLGIAVLSFLEKNLNRFETLMVATVIGIFLIINILYLHIYDVIVDRYSKKTENIVLNQQIEYYNNQHIQVESSLNEIKQLKHDLKFKLVDILQKEDISSIKKDITALIDQTTMGDYIAYTGNHGIDAILNFEISKAKKQDIKISIKATVYKEIDIDSKSLCVILGNALDNAIEANENISKKYIDINILNENNSLYILVSNPYLGNIVVKDNNIATSKKDAIHHGYGLKSMNDIAKELGGTLKISTDNNIFTLEILIFDF